MTRLIQITAYLRDETDLAKWKSLPNKTEWLHEHLNISDYGFEQAKELTQSLSLAPIHANPKNLGTFDPVFTEPTITPPEETL